MARMDAGSSIRLWALLSEPGGFDSLSEAEPLHRWSAEHIPIGLCRHGRGGYVEMFGGRTRNVLPRYGRCLRARFTQ